MANTPQAKKRIRRNANRATINHARISRIRTFVKQDCRKTIDGVGVATLQARYLRKKGQSQYDPRTDRETEGQFESYVRFELTK